MNLLQIFTSGILLLLLVSCSKQTTMTHSASTAPIIVYRTKADYTQYVPVRLSEDGSRIVAYPAPSDVRKSNEYRYPVKLKEGYYWDRQGVGATTAFLSITYAEYAALETAPDPETLLASILDSSPFLEMYHLGKTRDYQQVESELNEIIAQNRLNQFPSVLPEKKK